MSKPKITPKRGKKLKAKTLKPEEKEKLSNESPFLSKSEVEMRQNSKGLNRKLDSPIQSISEELEVVRGRIVAPTSCKKIINENPSSDKNQEND